MTFIAHKYTEKSTHAQQQEVFKQLDVDNDGLLTKADLVAGYRKFYDKCMASREVEEIIREADFNGQGAIDFTNWLAVSNCWSEALTE